MGKKNYAFSHCEEQQSSERHHVGHSLVLEVYVECLVDFFQDIPVEDMGVVG